jgi:hypothetical protein
VICIHGHGRGRLGGSLGCCLPDPIPHLTDNRITCGKFRVGRGTLRIFACKNTTGEVIRPGTVVEQGART